MHKCSFSVDQRDHRQAFAKLIVHTIQYKFEGTSSAYKAEEIIRDFQKHFGYDISYHKT